MTRTVLEKVAVAVSVAVLGGWTVFWILQVVGVIEFLEMAYG